MEFSIIIPAYNVEKYISKILDSILSENIPIDKYEIIIINDGSTDSTQQVISSYIENKSNISLITIDHSGLSVARNTGIKIAKGRYIMFVDADDLIVKNSFSPLLEYVSQRNEDIIGLKFSKSDEDGNISKYHNQNIPLNKRFEGRIFLKNNNLIAVAWGYLYRTKFLIDNNLTMIPGIYHEDEEFVTKSFYFAESVIMSDNYTYIYIYNRSNSIVNIDNKAHKQRLIRDTIKVIKSLKSIILTDSNAECFLSKKLTFLTLDAIRLLIREKHSPEFINEIISELKNIGTYPLPLKNYGVKYNVFRLMTNSVESINYWIIDSSNLFKVKVKSMI